MWHGGKRYSPRNGTLRNEAALRLRRPATPKSRARAVVGGRMFPVRAYLSARSPIDSFLLDHPLVFVMGANPDPNKVRAIFYGKRPVIDSCSR